MDLPLIEFQLVFRDWESIGAMDKRECGTNVAVNPCESFPVFSAHFVSSMRLYSRVNINLVSGEKCHFDRSSHIGT